MCGSRSDSLDELYLCLSSLFICATVNTGVSQYMAVCIDEDDGDGDDELDRFEEELMATVSAASFDQYFGENELPDKNWFSVISVDTITSVFSLKALSQPNFRLSLQLPRQENFYCWKFQEETQCNCATSTSASVHVDG